MSGYAKQGPVGGWIDNTASTPFTSAEANGLDTAVYQLKTLVFNVLDYGATGDGVTDDTTGIVAAKTAWLAAGKGILFFPPGDYVTTSEITVKPTADQTEELVISAYGARLLVTPVAQNLGTVTVTIASPGVFTLTAHGLSAGDTVYLTTTGALPTGLTASTPVTVIAAGLTADTFEVAAMPGGVAINTSGSQSGTHTLFKGKRGMVFQTAAHTSFRNLVVAGLQARVMSTAVTDVFLFTDGSAAGANLYDFVVRDCAVESGGVSGWFGNALHITGTTVGVFQCEIDNFQAQTTSNVTGTGILVDGISGATSSILINNPNITGFLYGIQTGTSSNPLNGGTIRDGTVIKARNNGVRMYTTGGTISGTHIEDNWLSAGSLSAGGGGLYFEGFGNIIGLQDVRGTGSNFQKWAVDTLCYGPTTIIGRSQTSTNPWLRVKASGTTGGRLRAIGIPASQMDLTAVTVLAQPTIDANSSVPAFCVNETYGTTITPDASLGTVRKITVTDTTAFQLVAPTNPLLGQRMTVEILNSSGGSHGAITVDSGYALVGGSSTLWSGATIANTKRRFIEFVCEGTMSSGVVGVWRELFRSSGDM